jgi:hypothetical protein
LLLGLLVGCAGSRGGGQPSTAPTSGGAAAFVHPSGPQGLKKGERHQVEINASEQQEWFIDLAAGEKVTFTIEATSTGSAPCTNWSWGFYAPAGGTLREQPQGPADTGQWRNVIEGSAEPSIVEGPQAGRYLVRVMADAACPQLHYTLGAS